MRTQSGLKFLGTLPHTGAFEMRTFAFLGFFVVAVTSVLPASAGEDWGRVLTGAAVALASRDSNPGNAAPELPTSPTETSYRLEWDKAGVMDASSRWQYCNGWKQFGCGRERMKSALEVAGQKQGILLMAHDSKAREVQARTSRPGYDPRTAPRQGLWRAPQGILTATITFTGYSCREQVSLGRRWGSGGRWMEEEYRVAVDLTVSSVETLEPIASARAEGSSTASFVEGDVRVEGVNVGGLISRRARPDNAITQAAERAMVELASQLLGCRQAPQGAGLVVAQVNGAEVVIMTIDGSDVRDAGVVEGMKYALRGAGVINPVTNRPSRGTLEIGAIEIVSISADIAQGAMLPGGRVPAVGAQVTIAPYQSLH